MPSVIPTNFEAPKDNFPFPAPFVLSSAERFWCMEDNARIIYIKRRHLEENIKTIESEYGMGEEERKRFLDYWCSPSMRDPSTFRAERDECFDIRQRVSSWMDRAKQKDKQPKSRAEKYAETAQQFFQNGQQTIPTSPSATPGIGYANIPDEQ